MESGRGRWRERTEGGRVESDEGVEEMVKERKKVNWAYFMESMQYLPQSKLTQLLLHQSHSLLF